MSHSNTMYWSEKTELKFDPKVHQIELWSAWKTFVDEGKIKKNVVPSYIAESWVRSRKNKVDPHRISHSAYIDIESLESKKSQNQYFISVARPVMENIYETLKSSRYIVVLYDREGYHLLRIGQKDDFERSGKFGIREGLCFEENKVGTCGFSLVKLLNNPIQVVGCEHYSALFHYIVGSYAPISDPVQGGLMGVIGIGGARTFPHPHTLGIAIAASKAIENYIRLDHSRKTVSIYGKALQTTMDSLAEGIIIIDSEGKIYEANAAAKEIFDLRVEEYRGKHFSNVFRINHLNNLIKSVLENRDREGQETEIQIQSQVYLTKILFALDQRHEVPAEVDAGETGIAKPQKENSDDKQTGHT